ncbi:MAG: PQQ-binding-like beta-propeller repeat protein [candidate division WOR-3 bacterium]
MNLRKWVVLVFGFVSLLTTGCFNKPPKIPQIVWAPESTYTRATVVVRVATTDPNKNKIYYIMDWGDNVIDTFPSGEEEEPFASGETVEVYHIYEKWSPRDQPHSKIFEIRASAKDDKGKIQKNFSNPVSIRVIYNDEPDRPRIWLKNEMGGIKTRQTFYAAATDPEGDSIAVRFSFMGAKEWTNFRASGDTIWAEAIFDRVGTQRIWAIAKDKKGSQSARSETLDFVTIDEGYVLKTFHAETRPDEGETETLGMQSSPAIASVSGVEYIFIGSEAGKAHIVRTSDMRQTAYTYPDVEAAYDELPWGNSAAVNVPAGQWYIANDQGELYCLSTASASKIWRYPNRPDTAFTDWDLTDAAFSSGYVYVVNRDEDSLYVLSQASGTKVGYYTSPGLTVAPSIDAQGNVYIGDDSGYVHKLNPTGGLIWKHKLDGSISTSPVIDGVGNIYIGANTATGGYLYALNPDSSLKWTYSIGENIFAQPAIGTDNNLYFCDFAGRVHAVNLTTGTPKAGWSLINLGAAGSSPAFTADNYFYINTEEYHVFCIGIDGKIRWETPLPVAAKKRRASLSKREDLLVLSPVIGSNGDIYVAAGEDEPGLYKLKGRTTGITANTDWPMFRHDQNHSGKAGYSPSR